MLKMVCYYNSRKDNSDNIILIGRQWCTSDVAMHNYLKTLS